MAEEKPLKRIKSEEGGELENTGEGKSRMRLRIIKGRKQ